MEKAARHVKGLPVPIDPNHEQLHKVRVSDMEMYKAQRVQKVEAICGKVWAPTIPFQMKMRDLPKCPGCFPEREMSYSLAC